MKRNANRSGLLPGWLTDMFHHHGGGARWRQLAAQYGDP